MSTPDPRQERWRSEFEAMGEESARLLDPGTHVVPSEQVKFLRVWLAMLESSKRDARDAETLSIAKEANTIALSAAVSASDANAIARSARKIAWIAAIAAIVAAVTTIIWGK